MSLLRSLVLFRNFRLAPLQISKLQDTNAQRARRFSSVVESHDPTSGKITSPSNLSSVQYRTYAKATKGGGGKKSKNNKQYADILDDLDSDSDDEDNDITKKKAQTPSQIDEGELLASTPAAQFIQHFGKGVKKDHHKDKNSKIKARGGHVSMVTYQEAKALINVDQYWKEMEDVVTAQRDYFIRHLTLRSTSALDDLPVVLEGDTFPLRELADISKKDPKRLIIDSSAFPQATVNIMKALRDNSGLNLNPQQDGTRIYVPIPKVTREHREKLSKGAKERCNETKEQLKKIQNRNLSKLGEIELGGKVHAPKDHFLAVHELLLGMTDHFCHEAEAMTFKKQKDLTNSS